jgi:hypothetical protein
VIAKNLAENEITLAEKQNIHHHAGILIIHLADSFNQIVFDWWAKENELRHKVFKAESHAPFNFIDITFTGEAFCVWEIKVIAFERDQWLQHILLPHLPAEARYFDAQLNTIE